MKCLVLTVALLSTPLAVWAQGSCKDERPTISCPEGMTLDQDTDKCVPTVS